MHYLRIVLIFVTGMFINSACYSGGNGIHIHNARIIETPPVTGMNAGYLEIENSNTHPVVLTGVTSDAYDRIELHQSFMEQGVAKMKRAENLTIAAQSRWTFEPGGYHLMLFGAARPMKSGDIVRLNLHFSDGLIINTDAAVIPLSGS